MDAGYVSALAALAGSIIGGLTSLAASWLSQNLQSRVQQLIEDRNHRRDLYQTFVEEASRLYGVALTSDKTDIVNLVELYALTSRMRMISSPRVVAAAEMVIARLLDATFAPNLTLHDVRSAIGHEKFDVLCEFSDASREDLLCPGASSSSKIQKPARASAGHRGGGS
jgi:hypothetical protein